MRISFKNGKIQKEFNQEKLLVRHYGSEMANKLSIRMAEFRAAESLLDLWPQNNPSSRCHELKGNMKGFLAVDLIHPFRLVFVPDHDPVPVRGDGGLNWEAITDIKIMEVIDYHD